MPEFGYKKHPGDRSLSAGAWNRLVNANTSDRKIPAPTQENHRDTNRVEVENGAGSLDPFGVLKVSGATWKERKKEVYTSEGMRKGCEITGIPAEEEFEPVTILQRSASGNGITFGVTSGPTPCMVEFSDAASLDYPYAVAIQGDTTKLKASPYGWIRILWHEEPTTPMEGCSPQTLQAYVNLGDDSQWAFFKLLDDLEECQSVEGLLVDNCGNQVGECPIIKEIWDSKLADEECECKEKKLSPEEKPKLKKDAIVLCFWVMYLEKWVAINPRKLAMEMTVPQVPSLACQVEDATYTNMDGTTSQIQLCRGFMTFPQKKISIDGSCVCEEEIESLALELPTPELLVCPTFAIEKGSQSAETCVCDVGVLTFPRKLLKWCEDCPPANLPDCRVEFPVVAENGGTFQALSNVQLAPGSNCGSVQITTQTTEFQVVCGKVCETDSQTETKTSQLFNAQEIEFVTDLTLSDLKMELGMTQVEVLKGVTLSDSTGTLSGGTPQQVVTKVVHTSPKLTFPESETTILTGGSVSLSGLSGTASVPKTTSVTLENVKVILNIPTTTKTVVTSVTTDGCAVIGRTETITVLNGEPTAELSGTPTVHNTPETVSVALSGNAPLSPTTTTLKIPIGISGGDVTPTLANIQIPTQVNLTNVTLTPEKTTINDISDARITGGTVDTQKRSVTVLICPTSSEGDENGNV